MRIRRGTAAEETQRRCGFDGVPFAGRDQDRIAGRDFARGAADGHFSKALEDEIKLLTRFVIVPFCGDARRHGGFRERLIADRRIGAV